MKDDYKEQKERTEDELAENGWDEGVVVYSDPDLYYEALIGCTVNGRAVYDYNTLVKCLMRNNNWSREDAQEWISFNMETYSDDKNSNLPIILYSFDDVEIHRFSYSKLIKGGGRLHCRN